MIMPTSASRSAKLVTKRAETMSGVGCEIAYVRILRPSPIRLIRSPREAKDGRDLHLPTKVVEKFSVIVRFYRLATCTAPVRSRDRQFKSPSGERLPSQSTHPRVRARLHD